MIKKKHRKIADILDSTAIVIPSLLGKNFRIEDDPSVYQVVGLRWRTQEIVLRADESEKLLTMIGGDFLKLATRID